jgi:predicted DCC family thiol-disulfide oxidoreductase YuxK
MSGISPNIPPFVLLFDGVCNLCNTGVGFVLDHEQSPLLRFASMQSNFGKSALTSHRFPECPSSIVLIESERVYTQSTAICRLMRYLRAPWHLLAFAIVIPAPIRDLIYDWIARNRYQWFGKLESCRVATSALANRFLD